jgi:hypothetical protein
MNTLRFSKWCRLAGKWLLIGAVIFLAGDFLELHIERSHRPAYFAPEDDEQRIVITYLCFLGATGLGCILRWLGSFFGPKNPGDLI